MEGHDNRQQQKSQTNNNQEKNSSFVIRMPSYEEVAESSQPKTTPSLFNSSPSFTPNSTRPRLPYHHLTHHIQANLFNRRVLHQFLQQLVRLLHLLQLLVRIAIPYSSAIDRRETLC